MGQINLKLIKQGLMVECDKTFSNWNSYVRDLDRIFEGSEDYIYNEFTRPRTDLELAWTEGCPSGDSISEETPDEKFLLRQCDDIDGYWIDKDSLEVIQDDQFNVDIEGYVTFELDPRDSGDCTRYYDVVITFPVCFQVDASTKEYLINNVGEPEFNWRTSEAY